MKLESAKPKPLDHIRPICLIRPDGEQRCTTISVHLLYVIELDSSFL